MSRVLIISNSSMFSQELKVALGSDFEVASFNYDLEAVSSHIAANPKDLILMHFHALSNEDVICFHQLLKSPTLINIPKVFIGDELDYCDHVSTWGVNFAGVLLTPVNVEKLKERLTQFLESQKKS